MARSISCIFSFTPRSIIFVELTFPLPRSRFWTMQTASRCTLCRIPLFPSYRWRWILWSIGSRDY